ncbi:Gar1/Naf1 RNA binding region-domain-containing protein [Lanmaoa asiatica]|nr:Gar1/Naf1 RNA binding region-domain-containing protein [Lanmaoa asiatica]
MDFDFKVPSTVPQDLLLIQDLIGTIPSLAVTAKHVPDSLDSSDDSIASTDGEVESEDEVEADLALRDEDSGMSDTHVPLPIRKRDVYTRHLSGKDLWTTSGMKIEPCDTLEKVGEIISIVGNIVIVRGLPVDHVNSLSKHTLDVESLLVFEDRKVLGYIYETFGPTSQPFYQVKFNQHYPLDTDKVWLSREVFHVPQRSHFVFVDQLKKLRGSDASNIHDEEPADDEIEFSDDEKEAACRAQRKKRQSTPAPSRIHIDDMVQDTYRGANPYDAHGPYDDDYHVTGPSRPLPVPYDDPYADVPTSGIRVHPMEMNGEPWGEPSCESGGHGPKASRGRISNRGTRGRGDRNRQLYNTSRRGYRHNHVASQRSFDSNTDQSFPVTSRMAEYTTGYGQIGDAIPFDSLVQPASISPEANNIQNYQQDFIQPHINPRFASMFGLNLPSGSMIPWTSQNVHDQVDTWTMHGSTGSEGEGDTYRPM